MKSIRDILQESIPLRYLITGTIHGNEQTPIAAIKYFQEKRIPGAFTIIPCLNPEGVRHNKRENHGKDMNREFGKGGMVRDIEKLVKQHDVIIDVHTHGYCINHIILDNIKQPEMYEWVKNAGVPVLGETTYTAEEEHLDNSLSYYAIKQGKLACTVELEGVPSMNHKAALTGATVIERLVNPNHGGSNNNLLVRREVKLDTAAIFESFVLPGNSVVPGQELGNLRNVNGDKISVLKSAYKGIVISVELDSYVKAGGSALYIGEVK